MFNLITPKKRTEFKKEMDQMHTLLSREFGESYRDEFDHAQTNYLVFCHKKFGVIGGARLISIDAPVLTTDFLNRLKFQSKHKIWEMSRVFFHIPEEKAKDENQKAMELIRRDFFQGLYDSLQTISIAQKIKVFISVLPLESHQEATQSGLWPFDKQAKIASPYKDNNPYVVGIMPMNVSMYDTFTKRRMSCEQVIRIS